MTTLCPKVKIYFKFALKVVTHAVCKLLNIKGLWFFSALLN